MANPHEFHWGSFFQGWLVGVTGILAGAVITLIIRGLINS